MEDSTGQDEAVTSVLVERKEDDVKLGWLTQEDEDQLDEAAEDAEGAEEGPELDALL